MSRAEQANKAIVRRLVTEVLNGGRLEVIDELYAPELAPATRRWITPFRTSFPDVHMEIVELIAEGDKVAGRFTCSATHLGEWLGHAATGRRFERVDEVAWADADVGACLRHCRGLAAADPLGWPGTSWSPAPDATEVTLGSFGRQAMKALHRRTAAVAILLASLLVLVPATAVAATKTYRFTVSGTEVSATSTTGRFVGAASGGALGTWYAEVNHEPLGASAAIRPGGSFGMALHQAEPAYLVSGQFSGGTITVNNSGAHCTNQVYTVNGYLRNVSVTGTGHVVATLTHHRKSVLGRCWLYAATVGGTVTLS